MAAGYFLVRRGLLDSPLFRREPLTEREAYLWLIENAAYAPRQFRIGSHVFDLQRGQVATTVRYLADRWRWSKSRVERAIAVFKTRTLIETQTGTAATVITVCGYNEMQDGQQSSGAQTGTQTKTEAGRKPGRNIKKEQNEGKEREEIFERDFWPMVPLKKDKDAAQRAFKSALKRADLVDILEGARRWAAESVGKDRQFIKRPATWLNAGGWKDEPEVGAAAAADFLNTIGTDDELTERTVSAA